MDSLYELFVSYARSVLADLGLVAPISPSDIVRIVIICLSLAFVFSLVFVLIQSHIYGRSAKRIEWELARLRSNLSDNLDANFSSLGNVIRESCSQPDTKIPSCPLHKSEAPKDDER